jgi:hypothetical protein
MLENTEGDCKTRNETETKRNETKRNETRHNRNETKPKKSSINLKKRNKH